MSRFGVRRVGKARRPMRPNADLAIAPRQRMAGGQLLDVLEDRTWRKRRPEREDVVEASWVELSRDAGNGEERLHFRREQQPVADDGVVQRTHAEPIAREEQHAGARVPDAGSPLTVERGDRVGSML